MPRVRPGGLLLADNVLWSGEIADDETSGDNLDALRAFNDLVAADRPGRDGGAHRVRRPDHRPSTLSLTSGPWLRADGAQAAPPLGRCATAKMRRNGKITPIGVRGYAARSLAS